MFKNPNKSYNYDYFSTATPLNILKNDTICDYISPKTFTRCKKSIGKYPRFCSKHTFLIDNLFISKSNIKNANNGLFAGEYGFKKNDIIGIYSNENNTLSYGDVIKMCDKIKNDSCWEYLLCDIKDIKKDKYNDNTICWDGSNTRSTITRYINDAFNTKYRNNCFFIIKKKRVYTDSTKKKYKMIPVAYVIASKTIKPYEEIFVSYGKNYWT